MTTTGKQRLGAHGTDVRQENGMKDPKEEIAVKLEEEHMLAEDARQQPNERDTVTGILILLVLENSYNDLLAYLRLR